MIAAIADIPALKRPTRRPLRRLTVTRKYCADCGARFVTIRNGKGFSCCCTSEPYYRRSGSSFPPTASGSTVRVPILTSSNSGPCAQCAPPSLSTCPTLFPGYAPSEIQAQISGIVVAPSPFTGTPLPADGISPCTDCPSLNGTYILELEGVAIQGNVRGGGTIDNTYFAPVAACNYYVPFPSTYCPFNIATSGLNWRSYVGVQAIWQAFLDAPNCAPNLIVSYRTLLHDQANAFDYDVSGTAGTGEFAFNQQTTSTSCFEWGAAVGGITTAGSDGYHTVNECWECDYRSSSVTTAALW